MIALVLASTGLYVGIAAGVVLLIVVIVVLLGGKKAPGVEEPKPKAVAPVAETPVPVQAGGPHHAPVQAGGPHHAPVQAASPQPVEVAALSPSTTGEAPMLGAESDELKMATDQMPGIGTAELPALGDDGPARYRTPAAQELSEAISGGDCPKCKAATFVGSEDAEEIGADGLAMYKLTGRCGACGHRAEMIDMRVG